MKKIEIELLKNEDFIRRILNYTHKSNIERICEAWMDSTTVAIPDAPWSEDFGIICEAIIHVVEQ